MTGFMAAAAQVIATVDSGWGAQEGGVWGGGGGHQTRLQLYWPDAVKREAVAV